MHSSNAAMFGNPFGTTSESFNNRIRTCQLIGVTCCCRETSELLSAKLHKHPAYC